MTHYPRRLLVFLLLFPINLLLAQHTDDFSQAFSWRNIGPANQGGRIVDIEAVENDFAHVYIATASGGVWKSNNAGTTWAPIFDDYEVASIGDIAIFQDRPEIIWVGTGEANNRNSVSWGNGVYRSGDGGKTFEHLGLENTHQISRVITHPQDSNTVFVGAIGHLWGYSGDRGLYKTTDSGKTWQKLTNGLPDDGKTGCTDLIIDPSNPDILYAAFYQRLRQPWTFYSGGANGGIFKSTDGGKSWKKLTKGLPLGETGRIGLAISRSNPKIIMALLEAKKTESLDKPGSGVYRSEDGGKSWKYVNLYNNRPFYYSQIRINPHDDQKVYLLTTRFMVSEDGGKTLKNGSEDQEVHGDFHAMWLDPNQEERYYLGADKGLSITHDHGQHFTLLDNFAIGQFYRINYDMRDPYYVYGGMQDNGSYAVASFSRDTRGILSDANWKMHWGDGQYAAVDPDDWRKMFTSMENGSYFQYNPLTRRIKRISPNSRNITNYDTVIPDSLQRTGREFRFNWSAPLIMSPFDAKTIYTAGNYVFKSTNSGESWTIISPDLSTNDPVKRVKGKSGGVTPDNTGAETHCAITSLSLSTLNPNLIWVGTDDGNVQVTRDGGQSWQNVRSNVPDVPPGIWVSRLEASNFNQGTAYLTFDGHRSDKFQPWVFKTTDFGKTWTSLSASLPQNEVVRVIREDLKNPNLLFIGTETGIFYTVNQGQRWQRFMTDFPTVSVYDLKIHPRENDLIAGTHGRSIWIADDISPLQQLNESVLSAQAWLFEQKEATIWENTSRGGQRGHFWFAGENPPTIERTTSVPRAGYSSGAMISYYIGAYASDDLELEISDLSGKYKRVVKLENQKGIHRYIWNREFDPKPYTAEEEAKVEKLFQDLMAQYSFGSLRRAYASYQKAKTPLEKRKIVQRLQRGFMSFKLDGEYGVPTAGPGTYWVTLKAGDQVFRQSLQIREDPLLKE